MRIIISAIFLFTVLLSGCSSPKEESKTTETSESDFGSVVTLEALEFNEKSSKGIVLDVRTPEEIAQGKIPGSMALDFYAADFLTKATELPKEAEIFVYCAMGARSKEAAQLLVNHGYTHVYHLHGGIQAWKRSGLPIE